MNRTFYTERLILKTCDIRDVNLILEYFKRNKDFLKEFEPKRDESFYTLNTFKRMIEIDNELFEQKQAMKFWIFKDNKIIGSVELNNIIWGVFLNSFIAYRMDKDEVRKGYMTEAVKKIVEIAFDKLGLHRLEANIMLKNIPSLKVVSKIGFEFEGIAKKYLKINGVWEDHVHMVLLNKLKEDSV